MVNETAEDMSVLTTEPEGVRFTLKFLLLYPLAAKFINLGIFTSDFKITYENNSLELFLM